MTTAPDVPRRDWFGEEVERLLPKLMGTARRFTRNRADAEDLVADAIATGWKKLDSLQDSDALGPWLCQILTNEFLSRSRTAAAKTDTEPYVETPSDGGEAFSIFERLHQPFLLWQSNPEQKFLGRLLREDLAEAIDALPDPFRLAVVLVDVQGLSYQEASESLEVPVGTIRSRLARARSRLQEALWKQAVDAGYRSGPDAPFAPHDSDRRGSEDE